MSRLPFLLSIFLLASSTFAADGPPVDIRLAAPTAKWIWPTRLREKGQFAVFRTGFLTPAEVKSARLYLVTDAANATVWINNKPVASAQAFGPMVEVDVTAQMRGRDDLLEVHAHAVGNSPAINVRVVWTDSRGRKGGGVSDETWFARVRGRDWPPADPINWHRAESFGALEEEPWGHLEDRIAINPFDDYEQWRQATGTAEGADPATFHVTPGFTIERLRSAGKDEGSWVSLTFDPKGRLLIAREDKGLLRLTLPAEKDGKIKVESINDTLHECRGMQFIGNDLYVNANNDKALMRLRDTGGDDRFDEITTVYASAGGVGHGRNDVTLGPDGFLYAIQGDSVAVPKDMASTLSPRRFAARPKAGEGFVYRFDPRKVFDIKDGLPERFEVIAAGLRNPYGVAFNAEGELFTYDADAEHDMGSPWYRPTRVRHIVSGADFGWRSVTGSWPPYYPDAADSPPSTFDIGKGSPTAIAFAHGSAFPGKYHDALYILDWAYGRILAVHMTPRGAGYACSAETFVKGRPFNVTDLAFGPEGAMYVTTGGRKTQSGLYRIRYTGPALAAPALTEQQRARAAEGAKARELRRKLESFHQFEPAAVDIAWPHLDSEDPWIRHAARIAVEHQPVKEWLAQALPEKATIEGLTALLALASASDKSDRSAVLGKLNTLTLKDCTIEQQLIALRTYEICLVEGETLTPEVRREIVLRLSTLYPGETWELNRTLSLLLLDLDAASLLKPTLALLESAKTQHEQMHYLFVLRNMKQGWSLDERKHYFRKLLETQAYRGGAGMPGFMKKIREEAIASLSEKERAALGALVEGKDNAPLPAIPQRAFVKAWTLAELKEPVAKDEGKRDLANGKAMFNAAACNRCHRFGDEGRSVGPDLTSVASRFSRQDMLQSIIEPSGVVAENYRNVRIELDDGEVIVGQVVMAGDYRSSDLRIMPSMMEPEKVRTIAKKRVVSHSESGVSPMPEGLLNTLTREDVLDLLAYLETGPIRRSGER
ncbi:MAG: hypothetical protein WD768_02515 [Phycisphaeraceae bacterium]